MKHNVLKSIAHNIADSLACGHSLFFGVFMIDIFGQAKKSQEGFITVDFLNGTITSGTRTLASVVKSYSIDVLPKLCKKQGALVSCFQILTASYSVNVLDDLQVIVEIKDDKGRSSVTTYIGLSLKKIKKMDNIERLLSPK